MKITVNEKLIDHLTELSQLPIPKSEVEKYKNNLQSIIGYMNEITQLDLKKVPETFRTIEEENIFRDDVVEPSFTQVQALSGAKKTHEGYFVVAGVLKEKE